jgi:predicted Holliday junction resolvase-like endonuclease
MDIKNNRQMTNNGKKKAAQKTKDWTTQIIIKKKQGELRRCSVRMSSSCSTGGIRRVTLCQNPLISLEWRKYWNVITTKGTYPL